MKIILFNILLFASLNYGFSQVIGGIRVNAFKSDSEKNEESNLDSLQFTVLNANTLDTLYHGKYVLQFKANLEKGIYKIIAFEKGFSSIEEEFIVSGDMITFIDLRFKKKEKVTGNFLMINQWTISFIKLKKNNEVNWYTRGCADRGTDNNGTWTQNGDTIVVNLKNEVVKFILIDSFLCYLDDKGKLVNIESGMPKTKIQAKWRVHMRARRIRNKNNIHNTQ